MLSLRSEISYRLDLLSQGSPQAEVLGKASSICVLGAARQHTFLEGVPGVLDVFLNSSVVLVEVCLCAGFLSKNLGTNVLIVYVSNQAHEGSYLPYSICPESVPTSQARIQPAHSLSPKHPVESKSYVLEPRVLTDAT